MARAYLLLGLLLLSVFALAQYHGVGAFDDTGGIRSGSWGGGGSGHAHHK